MPGTLPIPAPLTARTPGAVRTESAERAVPARLQAGPDSSDQGVPVEVPAARLRAIVTGHWPVSFSL